MDRQHHAEWIYNGGLVIVDRSLYAEHGDIVIAALDSEPVFKCPDMQDNAVILRSENSKYPPWHVMEGNIGGLKRGDPKT